MMFYADHHVTLYNHDCRLMPELADNSVQCVVTSPPYWGLRKYAGQQELIWGGRTDCEHEWITEKIEAEIRTGKGLAEWSAKNARGGGHKAGEVERINTTRGFCLLCGAWRGAFGLEPTPELYIRHTVEILREVRRVLRKDGVVFWNIGDSYANNSQSGGGDPTIGQRNLGGSKQPKMGIPKGLKPKDLCLIPFRVAIAAQEDGWWVRSDIIWSKRNPMPESVQDRPTESHEHILMLTRSPRYYWDAEAVREKIADSVLCDSRYHDPDYKTGRPERGYPGGASHGSGLLKPPEGGRNVRSVWEFATQPYKEAHFATFPEALPERCIKAATPEAGICPECGAPWVRAVEKSGGSIGKGAWVDHKLDDLNGKSRSTGTSHGETAMKDYQVKTTGWRASCKCKTDRAPIPAVVLDPFAGSGTSLWVAKKHNRRAVGYEISEEYCRLIIERCKQQVLL